MKQEYPQKKAFYSLLNRAVRKGEKVNREKQRSCGCNDKKTRQGRTGDISGKQKHSTRQSEQIKRLQNRQRV